MKPDMSNGSDDTSVAILKKKNGRYCNLLFHEKVTADNSAHRGVHPIVSLESHQENLAVLIDKALQHLPLHTYHDERRVCVGRDQVAKEKPDHWIRHCQRSCSSLANTFGWGKP